MKKFLSILFCLCMAVSLLSGTAAASTFPDVSAHATYAEAVEYLNDAGIMQGDSSGNFNPDKNVTRAQMAAILCRMLGETENLTKDGTVFSDVSADYWANANIVKAAELGIISGYQDGTFKPGNPVTYEQAVTMVVRATGLDQLALDYGGYPAGYLQVAEESGFLLQISAKNGDPFCRSNVAMLIFNYFNNNV